MTNEEELRYVKAAQRGDESAFEALVIATQKLVYNLALKLTGNPDDALDISQDTFIKAYRNLGSFRGESRFSAWMYRLCYNATMDYLRKQKSSNTVSLTIDDEDEDRQSDIPDTTPLPDEQYERSELRKAVREAVYSLPEDKRQIIIMREFSGMSYTDIASALGIEEGTVKSRLSRARLSLAEILKESGTFPVSVSSKGRKGGNGS